MPLRRLRRFFVPISSDYDRFELPRIIENPAESGSIEGGGEVGFKERERENEGRESSPSIVAPAAISTTEGDFPVFYGMKTGGFSRGRVLRGIFHPSLNTFRSDTVLGRILESSFDSSIKEKKRFVERIIVCLINFK